MESRKILAAQHLSLSLFSSTMIPDWSIRVIFEIDALMYGGAA
jgi:hypothetical protein